jgi:hypothetical protein
MSNNTNNSNTSQYFDNKDLFTGPKVTQYGNHMVMTQVHKETKKKYWNIDTQFSDDYDASLNYTSANNYNAYYTFTLPQPINDVKSIYVTNLQMPVTFHNISASLGNNSFKITYNNVYYYIIIPDGNYDATSLPRAINIELSSVGLTVISFSITNNYSKFTITNGEYSFDFAVTTNATESTSTTSKISDFDKNSIKSKLGWLLGFRNITYKYSVTFTSDKFIEFNRLHYLYLVVDEFSSNSPNSFISPFANSILNKNILAKIILDPKVYPYSNNGTIILPANHSNGYLESDRRTYSGKINLQKLKVQIVNEYGVPINFNGSDFSFSLEINYE